MEGLQYAISIAELPLIQLCLYGLEAYSVGEKVVVRRSNKIKKKQGIHLETYGQLWGYEVSLPDGRTVYHIRFASVDTSAERKEKSVTPNIEALYLKRDFVSSVCPQYEFLGDFHTHPYPYNTCDDVIRERLYEFSGQDFNSIEQDASLWSLHGYRIGLVLSIANLKNRSTKCASYVSNKSNSIEFTLSNYRFWIKAYVAVQNSKEQIKLRDEPVLIDCPSVFNPFFGGYCEFGKKVDREHIPGDI